MKDKFAELEGVAREEIEHVRKFGEAIANIGEIEDDSGFADRIESGLFNCDDPDELRRMGIAISEVAKASAETADEHPELAVLFLPYATCLSKLALMFTLKAAERRLSESNESEEKGL